MSKNKRAKRVLSSIAASAMILGTIATPAMAASGDYYMVSTQTHYSAAQVRTDSSVRNVLRHANADDVLVDFNSYLLKYTSANTYIAQLMGQGETLPQIGAALQVPNPATTTEDVSNYHDSVTVQSVSAINSTAVTVDNGTTMADAMAKLDQSVTLTLSDGTTQDVAIVWSCNNYDAVTAGAYTFTGKVTLPDGVTDPNNKVADVSATVTVSSSELAVQSVSAINGRSVQVIFTKAVDPATVISGTNLINITFTSVTTTPVTPAITSASATAELSTDGKVLTITPTGTEYFGGQYVVTVPTAVKDADGNSIAAYASVATLNDSVRPTISAPTSTVNGFAKFTLSEQIDATPADIAAAMTVKQVADGSVISVTAPEINIAADGKSFTFDMATAALVANKAYNVTFIGLKDYNGNLITPNPVSYTVTNSTVDTVAPTVTGITVTNDKKFSIKFSEALSAAPSITVNGTDVVTGTLGTVTVDPDDSTIYNVVLTSSAAGLDTIGVTAGYSDLSSNTGAAWSKLVQLSADTTPPTYVSSQVLAIGSDEYLVVNYSENVTVNATGNALTGTYVDSSSITKSFTPVTYSDASLYNPDTQGNSKSIKIKITSLLSGVYSATIPSTLVSDLATNAAAAQNVSFTQGVAADPAVPAILAVTPQATEDTVAVQFDRDVTAATALNTANYAIEGQNVFKSAIFDGDAQHVKLTLNPNVITLTGDRLFTIKNVATAAGKVMDPYSVTKTFVENVKPTLVSAAFTSASVITATFSENVTATATSDFEFYIDGVKQTTGVSNVAPTASKTVVITVPAITDLTKNYQIKYVGTDLTDNATPANTAPASALVTVTQ